jgi:hypothetical protein
VKLSPSSNPPDRKRPSVETTVWGSPSRFFHVTDPPTATVVVISMKAKFLMGTVTALGGAGSAAKLAGAAQARAKATARPRRESIFMMKFLGSEG